MLQQACSFIYTLEHCEVNLPHGSVTWEKKRQGKKFQGHEINFAKSGKTFLTKSFIVNGEKQCDVMLPFYHNRKVKQQRRRR